MSPERMDEDRPNTSPARKFVERLRILAATRAGGILVDLLVISTVLVVVLSVVYDVFGTSLRLPIGYSGDGLTAGMQVKTMMETGWIAGTTRLGSPFGQVLWDFPSGGDNGNYLMLKALTLFTSDWVLVVNVFFLLTFFTAGFSAYLCQRWMNVRRLPAVAFAVLFAVAPYHFARGIGHLFLSSYFVVPIGIVLGLKAARGDLFDRSLDLRRNIRRLAPWIILAIACASFGPYYAVFAGFAVVSLVCLSSIVGRRWAPVLSAFIILGVMGVTFVINLAPSIIYRRSHGVNPLVAQRVPIELDLYSLRIEQMLSPVRGHFFSPFARLASDLARGYTTETGQFLGLVGGVGFVMAIVLLVANRYRSGEQIGDERPRLAALILIFTLTGVAGGLSWFLWSAGLQVIRAWNRLSIAILFCALAWLGIWFSHHVEIQILSKRKRLLISGVLLGVLVFGLFDQLSYDAAGRDRTAAVHFRSDQDFFSAVERSLPVGASVYVLPYRKFPEMPPTVNSGDYDMVRPYLTSKELRWSYGGMKGRESEWQSELVGLTTDQFLESIVAVGFDGVLVDTQGYEDSGRAVVASISSATGSIPLESPDGRWVFIDVESIRAQYPPEALESRKAQLVG